MYSWSRLDETARSHEVNNWVRINFVNIPRMSHIHFNNNAHCAFRTWTLKSLSTASQISQSYHGYEFVESAKCWRCIKNEFGLICQNQNVRFSCWQLAVDVDPEDRYERAWVRNDTGHSFKIFISLLRQLQTIMIVQLLSGVATWPFKIDFRSNFTKNF